MITLVIRSATEPIHKDLAVPNIATNGITAQFPVCEILLETAYMVIFCR